jgi:proline racemase
MKDAVREILAQRAYEAHLGIKGEQSERYFKIDYCTWQELPESSKLHWKNIIFVVFRALDEINCGDLV